MSSRGSVLGSHLLYLSQVSIHPIIGSWERPTLLARETKHFHFLVFRVHDFRVICGIFPIDEFLNIFVVSVIRPI